MKADRDDLFVFDILECCDKIASYIDGVDEAEFGVDPKLQDAVVRNVEIIGEAAKGLSRGFRERYPEIPWSEIMRMRDLIVHHYFRVNLEVVWQTITRDIPDLRRRVGSERS